jgi:cell division inhibitor SepF
MDSMWRRAMLYLGLGPDDEYEEYDQGDDRVAQAAPPGRSAIPAREPAAVPGRSSAAPSRSRGAGPSPAPPVLARDPYETSAVRPLPTQSSNDPTPKPRGVVRPVPAASSAKPHLVAPTSFNQAQDIADKFKGSQPVILNLQGVDRDLQRRLIDFSSGLAYALSGTMSKAADQVFLLTPANVEVSDEEKDRLQAKGLYRAAHL